MKGFRHLVTHVKKYGRQHQALYFLALMILFWAIFDGTTTYITPLIITERGVSKTLMGIIIGTSSVVGAIFDFIMCKVLKKAHFRQIFMLMFGLCFFYLGVLYVANSVALFVLAMAIWGIYYDLKNFGSFDFVARFVPSEEHASSFGLLQVFQATGYLIAPILAGLLIGQTVGKLPFFAALIVIGIAGMFLLRLLAEEKRSKTVELTARYNYKGMFQELKLWLSIDKIILPVLLLNTTLCIIDAFFWTVGPLLAESFRDIHPLAGFFMAAYTLPTLLVGWLVGGVTARFGKKRTAFIALLVGSGILSLIRYSHNSVMMIVIVFLASFCIAFAWPALKATFADYISETRRYEKEIEGLEDFYTNLGYVIGPMTAGIVADRVGNQATFGYLGIFGMIMALVLLKVTPRKINLPKRF